MSLVAKIIGMMGPRQFAFKGQGASTGTTVTKPVTAEVGDTVFVTCIAGSATSLTTDTGDAWSKTTASIVSGALAVYFKILTPTDVLNDWVFDAATNARVIVFGGGLVYSITEKFSVGNSGTSISSSYTPGANHQACVVFMAQANAGTVTDNNTDFEQLGAVIPNNGVIAQGFVDYEIATYAGGAISFTFASSSASAKMIGFEVA